MEGGRRSEVKTSFRLMTGIPLPVIVRLSPALNSSIRDRPILSARPEPPVRRRPPQPGPGLAQA